MTNLQQPPSSDSSLSVTRRTFSIGAALGVGAALAPVGLQTAQADDAVRVPAFPGAEGCGRWVTGGRGGSVYVVTTLADSGPGSLRDAVSASNRTVVFAVSGTIELASRLDIKGSNVTVAGQTAPGDGICIAGYPTRVAGSNVVVRYLRCRMGDVTGVEEDAMWARRTQDVVIDHCSLTWSTDEALSVYENVNVTVQWCLVAESLTMSVNHKGRHGYGGIWGGDNVTYHHNLIAHHTNRNPRFAPRADSGVDAPLLVDHRNNVIYNWGFNSSYGGESSDGINMIGNYYRPGPNTLTEVEGRIVEPVITNLGGPGDWFVDGNVVEGFPDVTADNWLGVHGDVPYIRLDAPATLSDGVETDDAAVALDRVLDGVGAILPRRDAVDARIVADVRAGRGRHINSQSEVGGWPELHSAPALLDTDGDGIPDEWEIAHGLDPFDPSDGSAVGDDGYTNLERYLNSITAIGAPNPEVRIVSPVLDSVVRLRSADPGATTALTVRAVARGQGARIAAVEVRAGDRLLGTASAPPYAVTWADAPEGTHYVTATAIDATGSATGSSAIAVHVVRGTDLGPWRSHDLGGVPIRGAAGAVGAELGADGTPRTIAVRGSGSIGGTADTCQFVYRELVGDGELVTRVDSYRKAYPELLGGLMIRRGLGPSAPSATLALTWVGNGLVSRVVTRATERAAAEWTQFPARAEEYPIAAPYWLRLRRTGTLVAGAISADGVTWHDVGTAEIALAEKAYVGLAVDGHQEANEIHNYGGLTFSETALTAGA
ncbi:hypothetical protein Bcav_3362 [Beutenbergia cavernae DSM 12333]|uniref:Pectate lyase n=1 Tax=Beutenbergia cavernae (strain ATCC BAA-8 / DSM 12333 / CCUG 43141 / JCM 11478 / NBRC 16432 / NCIMB 13614 / HKI 0122) TaxID=471853 RepID=C5C1J4_BEUC1|nr:Ig-like domain-containing protein [Beutenbergia cavernae]ACQ81604.1 hypothetical protein Bcav_3362 [Beutenbergia cavernae DSM 12333]